MSDYRTTDPVVVKRGGAGRAILIVLVVIAVVVGLLFATGFWSANVKNGALPEVSVKGGAMPKVDMDSKEVVVGTSEKTVDVPKVKTEKETVSVPTIGVNDDNK